ncbi:hypothetical protein PHSY_003453 [Pseudozyma hubeiensis SY62]|uniref:Uncharacterized protein n=1 Tax=Pseudozyma hubeiensis (strain SY62) TaxID=1305764 RepID=R9PCU2_PSEHS|nr:hypothetical protein PHSY_003453 [Pseudozyma hubeiensis SY62]GAC95875.1 hypothetical protein PHSY_003453 [Pseudozyma hubeiensis SY62]
MPAHRARRVPISESDRVQPTPSIVNGPQHPRLDVAAHRTDIHAVRQDKTRKDSGLPLRFTPTSSSGRQTRLLVKVLHERLQGSMGANEEGPRCTHGNACGNAKDDEGGDAALATGMHETSAVASNSQS